MWELHFGGCVRTLGYRFIKKLGVAIWGIWSPGRGAGCLEEYGGWVGEWWSVMKLVCLKREALSGLYMYTAEFCFHYTTLDIIPLDMYGN